MRRERQLSLHVHPHPLPIGRPPGRTQGTPSSRAMNRSHGPRLPLALCRVRTQLRDSVQVDAQVRQISAQARDVDNDPLAVDD